MSSPLDEKGPASIECWKQHTCASCGTVYRYRMRREAATDEEALALVKSESDRRPCPQCGLLQPEMYASSKLAWDGVVAALAVLTLLVVVMLGYSGTWEPETAAKIGVVIAGVAFLAHLGGMFINPNRDRGRNQAESANAVIVGGMQVIQPGTEDKPAPRACSIGHIVALLAIAGGGAAFAYTSRELDAIELPPGGKHAPGGVVRVFLAETVPTVDGLWNGVSQVTVRNAKELGIEPKLNSGCAQYRWGESIRTSSTSNRDAKLYVDVYIPDKPELDGKTLELDIALSITFPFRTKSGVFDETSREFVSRGSITLDSAKYEQAEQLWTTLGMGGVAGVALGCLAFVALAIALRNQGNATRLDPIEANAPPDWR